MGLVAWFPLNGTLKDIGPRNYQLTNHNCTVAQGQAGQCYSFGSNKGIEAPMPLTSNDKNFTCMAWVYCSSLFNGGYLAARTGTSGKGFLWYQLNNGTMYFDDGVRWTTTATLTAGKWQHLCITRSPSGKKLYINGNLVDSTSAVGDYSYIDYTALGIGYDKNYGDYMQGLMYDVRIYNHCLSAKDIHAISRGLALHWLVNNQNCGRTNIGSFGTSDAYNGSNSKYGYNTESNLKLDSGIFNGLPGYKISTITPDVSAYPYFWISNSSPTSADKCRIVSFYAYSPVGGNWVPYSYAAGFEFVKLVNGAWSGSSTEVSISVPANTWTRVVYRIKKTGSNSGGCGYVRTVSHTAAANKYFLVSQIKIEECGADDRATPYIPLNTSSSFTSGRYNIEYDVSGFGNNAIIYSYNDPITAPVLKFGANTTSHYWLGNASSALVKPAIGTICARIYGTQNSWSSDEQGIFGNWDSGGWGLIVMSGTIGIYLYSGGSWRTVMVNNSVVSTKAWHHLAATYDGTTVRLYCDGVQVGSTAYSGQIQHNSNNTVYGISCNPSGSAVQGNRFQGYVSDCRIYATALSADDIKILANGGAL